MADALDAKWDKLMAMMERLASQAPPAVHVHVNVAEGTSRKRRAAVSTPSNPSEFPEPGGQPRPYTS